MIEIVTGKTWAVHCKRQTSAGVAVPFETGNTLRAALRETPAGNKLLDVTATITAGTEEFDLSLTDEQTATLPEPRQFGAVRFLWLDVDEIAGTDILPLIVNEQVSVKAGVTKAEVVEP